MSGSIPRDLIGVIDQYVNGRRYQIKDKVLTYYSDGFPINIKFYEVKSIKAFIFVLIIKMILAGEVIFNYNDRQEFMILYDKFFSSLNDHPYIKRLKKRYNLIDNVDKIIINDLNYREFNFDIEAKLDYYRFDEIVIQYQFDHIRKLNHLSIIGSGIWLEPPTWIYPGIIQLLDEVLLEYLKIKN